MSTIRQRMAAILSTVILGTTMVLSGGPGAVAAPTATPTLETATPATEAPQAAGPAQANVQALSEGAAAIQAKYAQLGSSVIGVPTTSVVCGLADGGCYQGFERGGIHWSPSTGAHFTRGLIRSKWAALGAENGFLGYPTTDEICGLAGGGCFQGFQGGGIHYSPAVGTYSTRGAIRARWAASGAENGSYGYPTSDEACRTGTSGGTLCTQTFQGGTIKWRSDVGIIDCAVQKCVALTFDDGPGPHTSRLLDTLDARNVQATFFVIGQNVANYATTEQRAYRNGNEIMNHSWSHPDLTTLGSANIASQLSTTSDRVGSTVGRRPTLMRPPYGAYNSTVTSVAGQQGMSVVLWNIDTLDWKYRDATYVRGAAVNTTTPGSIVLMHDIHSTTVDAVPGIIADLKAKGYTLVTVSDLIGKPQPGKVYNRRP